MKHGFFVPGRTDQHPVLARHGENAQDVPDVKGGQRAGIVVAGDSAAARRKDEFVHGVHDGGDPVHAARRVVRERRLHVGFVVEAFESPAHIHRVLEAEESVQKVVVGVAADYVHPLLHMTQKTEGIVPVVALVIPVIVLAKKSRRRIEGLGPSFGDLAQFLRVIAQPQRVRHIRDVAARLRDIQPVGQHDRQFSRYDVRIFGPLHVPPDRFHQRLVVRFYPTPESVADAVFRQHGRLAPVPVRFPAHHHGVREGARVLFIQAEGFDYFLAGLRVKREDQRKLRFVNVPHGGEIYHIGVFRPNGAVFRPVRRLDQGLVQVRIEFLLL